MPHGFRRPVLSASALLLVAMALQGTLRPGDVRAAPTPSEANAEARGDDARRLRRLGWSGFTQGGYLHQFETQGDSGGSFSVSRFFVQAGASYAPDLRSSVSLALGYGFDDFRFAGSGGLPALRPWGTVHNARLSAPVRWGFDARWTLFVIPTIRMTAEGGADVEDALQGGGLVGVSYRFGDRLTLGPGIGVITEIEDTPTVFPVLLVRWKITERLLLATGRGVGATLGPGLVLSYTASRKWTFFLGGRYEKLRFRLDRDGPTPRGVGEDRSFPLFTGVTYSFFPMGRVSLVGGVELGEEHRLEDAAGKLMVKDFYDPAGFVGLNFNVRF